MSIAPSATDRAGAVAGALHHDREPALAGRAHGGRDLVGRARERDRRPAAGRSRGSRRCAPGPSRASPGARRGGGAVLTVTAYDPRVDIDWGEGDYERTAVRLAPDGRGAGRDRRGRAPATTCSTSAAGRATRAWRPPRAARVVSADRSLAGAGRHRPGSEPRTPPARPCQTIVADGRRAAVHRTGRSTSCSATFAVIFAPDAAGPPSRDGAGRPPRAASWRSATWLPGGGHPGRGRGADVAGPGPARAAARAGTIRSWVAGLLAERRGARSGTVELLRASRSRPNPPEAWLAEHEEPPPGVARLPPRGRGPEAWDGRATPRPGARARPLTTRTAEAYRTTSGYAVIRSVREVCGRRLTVELRPRARAPIARGMPSATGGTLRTCVRPPRQTAS